MDLLRGTSGLRPSPSAGHNGGLTRAEGSGDQLCPALPNGQDGKRREKKKKKPHPTLPRERRRPAPCPEVTPSCLVLALLCASTSLAVLCAWPSCSCAEPCVGVLLHPGRASEGGAALHASTAPGQGPHAASTDPPRASRVMVGGGSACLGHSGEKTQGRDLNAGRCSGWED